MPSWIPRSAFGLILAGLYVVVAIFVVVMERREAGGGNWITLKGMGSYLITLPVSLPGEKFGRRPDFRRNLDMAVAIGTCALLVFGLGAGVGKLARLLIAREGS